MTLEIVFETHSWSEDNDRGVATGWLPGRLSERGRLQAAEIGDRRRDDAIGTVFTSDLARATETACLAFGHTDIPVLHDWRLRECDYGDLNGAPVTSVHRNRRQRIDQPYPRGESWRQAVTRVSRFLDDLPLRWSNTRILLIGHVATRWAFDHVIDGKPLDQLVDADFAWRAGWEYRLSSAGPTAVSPPSDHSR